MEELDLLYTFLDEAENILARWETLVFELDNEPNQEGFNALFRLAHTLKGSSKAVGLIQFGDFIHKVEDLITELKEEKIHWNTELPALSPELKLF